MANMSYCRFRNTFTDLRECLVALTWDDPLSVEEAKAGQKMFEEFLGFCKDTYIIEGFDRDALTDLFKSKIDSEDS